MAVITTTGRSFEQAVCKHLGVTCEGIMNVRLQDAPDNIFSVQITIALSAKDLSCIAEIMGAPREANNT